MKGHKVPFLTKYHAAFGNKSTMIVPTRDFIMDIIQLALRKSQSSSTLEVFKTSVKDFMQISLGELSDLEVDAKVAEMVAVTIFARRDELATILTELVFRQSSDSYLLDYNYNIETTISSDTFSKVNEQLLVVELFLA